ncbi:PTS transporter subunit EIIC [Enterococcus hulanensis]|uniref:PTS sugar transporter subunit IIC n=1 Tax=Enterococcus TaxID=1350 RepID=UPI000B5A7FFB|nr:MULTISPECIES: PTS transporter subunit EIIC [Enterococcus]MBO0410871.1 PTS sugar transporter subunit IIC [Enterococcus hulanensis]MDT2662464.1 PTS transporter subunit EIIC [Enterococcus hulanensis]OTO14748.1 PTS system, cellobiose-specific IIC component [Enterococcus sp. 3H8_DIV0648]
MNNGFMGKMTDVLGKFATKVNSLRYIMVIKNAFASLIPVIITGAFGTLFSAMVFDNENGLARISALSFLAELKPISAAVSYVTLSFLTIYAVFLIGIELAKLNNVKGIFPGIIAVMSYLSVNPFVYEFVNADNVKVIAENVLAKQYTDTKGLFLGMFVAIASIELYCWLGRQDRLKLKMPDTVPTNVSESFSALFPTILTVSIIATVGFIVKALTGMYAYDIIYNIVQRPLEGIVQGLPGILLLMFIAQVFWVIGIHGNQMVKPVREPLLLAAIAVNTEAFEAGKEIPNIITMPFWDMYMSMGGSGVTIGLLIAILLVSKRDDMKEITKLSLAPGIFNINEPVIFGMPIMLNPILAIPFIITPLITGTIGYVATSLGFAAKAVVMVPWPMPPIVNAYLATAGDIGAVITQIVCIAVSILIYLPFVKISNKATTEVA